MTAQPPAPPERERGEDERPRSPFDAVATLSRPVVTFVWVEKRGVALTAVLYALGLVVWSLNASRRDLGIGAAADLQYLIAGLVPALVLALALAVLVAWLKVPAWSRDRLRTRWPRVATGIYVFGAVLGVVSVFSFATLGPTGVLDRFPVLAAVVFVGFGAGVILTNLAGNEETWLFRLVWYGYGFAGLAALVVLAFAFYAEAIFPSLPQSLGGGRPRCAQLDLDARLLSASTLAELGMPAPAGEIVRTGRLDVVFAQGDTLFVTVPRDSRVVELRGGSIQAVVGCD
jgi:hypothetical protein